MSKEGFPVTFWADVVYVRLMSNFHTSEQGEVSCRVSGQVNKETRSVPIVIVEYNNFMDFIRELYMTHRGGKKWWSCLYFTNGVTNI